MFTSLPAFWNLLLSTCTVLSVTIAAIAYFWSAWKNGAIKGSIDAMAIYRNELDAIKLTVDRLRDENIQLKEQTALLQGQINILEKLPLNEIAVTLKEIAQSNRDLMSINLKVLERLDNDAITLRDDTKHVANEVANVKTDLAKGK